MESLSQEVVELIENNAIALATTDENGNPHVIAAAYVKVVEGNCLLISDVFFIQTVKNIKKNPNVSVCVWPNDWVENCVGYELKGTAEYYTQGKWFDEVQEINAEEPIKPKAALLIKLNNVRKLKT